jgi:hypothetical protein
MPNRRMASLSRVPILLILAGCRRLPGKTDATRAATRGLALSDTPVDAFPVRPPAVLAGAD